jgi:hypothetical protein
MVGQNLQTRADDEHHQQQIEEVLPAHPRRDALLAVGRRNRTGVVFDERRHSRHGAQFLSESDGDDQQHEADRDQPQQVEPLGFADPHPWCGAVADGQSARPVVGVDDVVCAGELASEVFERGGTGCSGSAGFSRSHAPRVPARNP